MDRVIIIAEAGANHNGELKLAYNLVDLAKKCGADFIKFQTSIPELHISKFAKKAKLLEANTKALKAAYQFAIDNGWDVAAAKNREAAAAV